MSSTGTARALGTIAMLTAAFALWARPSDAKCEFIGYLGGDRVYLIHGPECVSIPAGDPIHSVELTYTGPPQPGVFTDVQLSPPFDSFETDGSTHLTVFAGVPLSMPCDGCSQEVFRLHSTLPSGNPGDSVPIDFVENGDAGATCSGTVQQIAPPTPALGSWAVGALAASLLATSTLWVRRRSRTL